MDFNFAQAFKTAAAFGQGYMNGEDQRKTEDFNSESFKQRVLQAVAQRDMDERKLKATTDQNAVVDRQKKFSSLDDFAKQVGITKESLPYLRARRDTYGLSPDEYPLPGEMTQAPLNGRIETRPDGTTNPLPDVPAEYAPEMRDPLKLAGALERAMKYAQAGYGKSPQEQQAIAGDANSIRTAAGQKPLPVPFAPATNGTFSPSGEVGQFNPPISPTVPTPDKLMGEKKQVWTMLQGADAETQQGIVHSLVQSGDWQRMFGEESPVVGADGQYQVHFADAPPVKAPVDKNAEYQKLRHQALQSEVSQLQRSFADPHTTPEARSQISARLTEIKKYAPESAPGYVPKPSDRSTYTPMEQQTIQQREVSNRISQGHLALAQEHLRLQKAGVKANSPEVRALASKIKAQGDWLKRVYMDHSTSPEMRANAQAAMQDLEKEFPGSIGFVPTDGAWGDSRRTSIAPTPKASPVPNGAQPVPNVTLPKRPGSKVSPGKYGTIIKIERVNN